MSDLRRSVGEVLGVLEARIPEPWALSPWPGALMGHSEIAGEVSLYGPRAVSLEAVDSQWTGGDTGQTRRRRRNALHTTTRVRLAYLYAVATDDGTVPYRTALDAEAELITAMITHTEEPVRVQVSAATREVTENGWVTGRVTLSCTHEMPLTPGG